MKKLITILLILCLTAPVFGQWSGVKPMLGTQIDKAHQLGGPVGAWFFLEGSGGQVFDLSGNGNTGTLIADTHWVPGKFDSALDFDGTGDYVTMGNIGLNLSTTNFTIVTMFQANTLPAGASDIFHIIGFCEAEPPGAATDYISISIQNDVGTPKIKITSRGETAGYGTAINTNQWYHVALVWDGTSIHLYLDSILDYSVVPGGSNWQAAIYFSIGREMLDNADHYDFDGLIDSSIVYGDNLSASEIALLYREPFCMLKEDLPVELMAQEAPAPGGGQVIIISMILVCFVYIKQRRKYSIYGECYCS